MLLDPIKVSRIDPKTMLFMYNEDVHPHPDGEYPVPGNCVLELAPEPGGNARAKWISDVPLISFNFGREGTGRWEVVEYYLKTDLFLASNGAQYEIDSDVDGESYAGIGPLPAWLTLESRPSRFHHYTGGAWVLDEQEKLASLVADKVAELSAACQAQIYAGFESSALGVAHHYPALDKDQQNLTASVLDSTVPGLPEGWQTPFWCELEGVWAFRMHSAEQIQTVGRDGKQVILACMAQNAVLAGLARAVADNFSSGAGDLAAATSDLATIVWVAPQL